MLILSEQYDAFVKFNYDQVQRRISEHPASCKFYHRIVEHEILNTFNLLVDVHILFSLWIGLGSPK